MAGSGVDGAGQPVAGVAIGIPGRSPAGLPDLTYTNDAGKAWLPALARGPTVRVGRLQSPTAVSEDGVFRVSTRRVLFDPIDDGLGLVLIDALGVAHRASASQGHIQRELTGLPEGPARLEAWRGDACAVIAVESDRVTPPEPAAARVVAIEVHEEDGRPLGSAEVWRAAPADLFPRVGRRAVADDTGIAKVPACALGDLFVAADPQTGRWGLGVGLGPLVTRLDASAKAAVVLGGGGIVVEPSETLGLRRFDQVVRWGRARTDGWTAEDAAMAVWGATGPVKVKVIRQDGGKAKLVVPRPAAGPV